jgi:16S rRNA (uracil1498-N3)-methyltransferase
MARTWRIYHPELSGRSGELVRLDRAEAHHVHRVLRLRGGERVRVFDGAGRERNGELVVGGAGAVDVRLESDIPVVCEPALEVALFAARCKAERMDWLVQKATEIGVSSVHPFPAARSSAPEPAEQRLRRWRRIVLEACKQSGRARLPRIQPRDNLPPPDSAGALGLLLDPGPEAGALSEVSLPCPAGPIWLAVGPESGFGADEASAWIASGWLRIGLGPRTLRTETAALVALALVMQRWGDLGGG